MAEEWLSPELLSALRFENLRGDLTQKRSEIVRQIKAQVVGYLRSGSFNSRRLADIVNIIRQDATAFKEWHGSDVAKLFAPSVFRNRKEARGYFFLSFSLFKKYSYLYTIKYHIKDLHKKNEN